MAQTHTRHTARTACARCRHTALSRASVPVPRRRAAHDPLPCARTRQMASARPASLGIACELIRAGANAAASDGAGRPPIAYIGRRDSSAVARAMLQAPWVAPDTRDALLRFLELAFPSPARERAVGHSRFAGGGGKVDAALLEDAGRPSARRPLTEHLMPPLAREALLHGLRVGNRAALRQPDGSCDVTLYVCAVGGADVGAFVERVVFRFDPTAAPTAAAMAAAAARAAAAASDEDEASARYPPRDQ
eukprot:6352587-Prymnesium_polylepis.1